MFIKKIADFIVFSSIFIAACAVAMCMQTNIVLHLPLNMVSFYVFVFGATLTQYNLHYLFKKTAIQNSKRLEWSLKNKNIHKLLLITGIILIIISLFSFRLHHFIILGVLAFIAFLYSFPVIPFGKKKRIKDFGFIKILTLALLWTLVTVWFPLVNFSFDEKIFLLVFFERFMFLFILCLLFDIRDVEIDRKENILTIAVFLGKKKAYLIVYISLIILSILVLLQLNYAGNVPVITAMLISILITFFSVEVSKKTNADFFYLAGVDGMMMLQALLVYVMV